MKLPITDQFLRDIYNVIYKTSNVTKVIFPTDLSMSHMLYGENPVFKKYRKDKSSRDFAKFIYYLKTKNYIKVKNLEGKNGIILTKEGIDKALKASFKMDEKEKRKDGKWTMLIFDMPSKNRKARTLMRSVLFNLGYKILQQSVWVTPYDVSEKTESLLQFYSLDRYVKIFLIEQI